MSSAAPLPSTVRLAAGPDLAAALPHLLGFAPEESLVVVALSGARARRVGLTLRVDLPPPGLEAAVAGQVVGCLADSAPDAAVVLVVTEEPDGLGPAVGPRLLDDAVGPVLPGRALLAEVVGRLTDAGVTVPETLLVRSGRCWSYDCAEPCCAPGAGRPLPGGTSPLAVASTVAGRVPAASRDALVERLAPVVGAEAAAVAAACDGVAAARAAELEAHGWEHLADTGWDDVCTALARCAPGSRDRLTDDDVARAGFALVDTALRDRALALGLVEADAEDCGGDGEARAAAAETLWTELTRRLPAPLDAAPATLLAVCAWSRGDGTTAHAALDRALDSRPDHALAQLLRSALDAALPPADLRRLVAAAVGADPRGVRAAPGAASPPRARGRRGTR